MDYTRPVCPDCGWTTVGVVVGDKIRYICPNTDCKNGIVEERPRAQPRKC